MAKPRRKPENDSLVQDVIGIVAMAFGVILFIATVTPNSGLFGRVFGDGLRIVTGIGAFVVPFFLIFAGWVLVRGARHIPASSQLVGTLMLFVAVVTLCQFAVTSSLVEFVSRKAPSPEMADAIRNGGGYLGFGVGYVLEVVFGRAGSFVIDFALIVVSFLLITGVSLSAAFDHVGDFVRNRINISRGVVTDGLAPTVRRSEDKPQKPKLDEVEGVKKPELLSLLKLKRKAAMEAEIPTDTKVPVVVRENISKPAVPAPRPTSTVPMGDSEFKLPPVSLLKEPAVPPKRAQAELNYKIDKIEKTLEEFKIEANVVEISHGPTVTRYEVQLAPGIKVNKIVSLADNLAMALAAIDVRVEAPIPGKCAIGVEVPNNNPATVTLREVIETPEFWNAPSKLTFVLGKDVAGVPKFADLTKMPHILIAGATNSGKSICLNALITSILYRATPREVKFILIDPKRVELSLFDGIPHLCSPVIKDVRQAAGILRTVLKEMDHRYDLFVQMGTRNFEGYNQKCKPDQKLPYIVVVIDELADLMMQAGPDVEFCICRLAQLARATGIHLVIATQRPSVDVVTGLIKANISSRISFAVSSQIDSRTVLDAGGAERLIGRGDMLFKPIDVSKPTRIQGCFLSERETDDIVSYLKEQEKPVYTMEPSHVGEGPGGGGNGGGDEALADEVYEPAVRLVVTSGYASTSMIQRRFKIGYTRAARLVDAMEEHGIVGPLDGAKPREVLIQKGDLDRIFGQALFGDSGSLPEQTEDLEEEE